MTAGLNKRDTTSHLLDGALIEPITDSGPIRLRRYLPSEDLAGLVRHFWFVSWEFPAGQSYLQPVLPLPAVNAVVEDDGAWVYGVWSRRYDKWLSGRGNAWGVLFLPTGFASFWPHSIHALRDRRVAFGEVFAPAVASGIGLDCGPSRARGGATIEADALVSGLHAARSDTDGVALLERYLLPRASLAAEHSEVQAWVASIERNPTLIRVEQLAELHGVNVRTLQRAMRRYVGLGPKQLIRRYRLLEAASRLASGEPCNQANLALTLGYADQAHFARDFRAVIGNSPGRQGKRRGSKAPHPVPVSSP